MQKKSNKKVKLDKNKRRRQKEKKYNRNFEIVNFSNLEELVGICKHSNPLKPLSPVTHLL